MVKGLLKKLTQRKKQAFYKPIDAHSATHDISESASSISMWNNVNHLGKHDFAYGYIFPVESKLLERKGAFL